MNRAEAEVKIQICEDEHSYYQKVLRSIGFTAAHTEIIDDNYIKFSKSEYDGYDFTRIRTTNSVEHIYTEKEWKEVDGNVVRLENERKLTEEQYASYPQSDLRLHKLRLNYVGFIGDLPVTVSFDTLNMYPDTLRFLECEAIVNAEEAAAVQIIIRNWIRNTFVVSRYNFEKAPSMLDIILEYKNKATLSNVSVSALGKAYK